MGRGEKIRAAARTPTPWFAVVNKNTTADGMRLDLMRDTDKWYWVNVPGWGCGAVIVDRDLGTIADAAPIFRRRYVGRTLGEMCDDNPEVEIVLTGSPRSATVTPRRMDR